MISSTDPMITSPDNYWNWALGWLENSVSMEFTSPQVRTGRKPDEIMEDSNE